MRIEASPMVVGLVMFGRRQLLCGLLQAVVVLGRPCRTKPVSPALTLFCPSLWNLLDFTEYLQK